MHSNGIVFSQVVLSLASSQALYTSSQLLPFIKQTLGLVLLREKHCKFLFSFSVYSIKSWHCLSWKSQLEVASVQTHLCEFTLGILSEHFSFDKPSHE